MRGNPIAVKGRNQEGGGYEEGGDAGIYGGTKRGSVYKARPVSEYVGRPRGCHIGFGRLIVDLPFFGCVISSDFGAEFVPFAHALRRRAKRGSPATASHQASRNHHTVHAHASRAVSPTRPRFV